MASQSHEGEDDLPDADFLLQALEPPASSPAHDLAPDVTPGPGAGEASGESTAGFLAGEALPFGHVVVEEGVKGQVFKKLDELEASLEQAMEKRVEVVTGLVRDVLLDKRGKWVGDFEKFLKVRLGLRNESASGAGSLSGVAEHLLRSAEDKAEQLAEVVGALGVRLESGPEEATRAFFMKSLTIEYANTPNRGREETKQPMPQHHSHYHPPYQSQLQSPMQMQQPGQSVSKIERVPKRKAPALGPRSAPEGMENIPFPYSLGPAGGE